MIPTPNNIALLKCGKHLLRVWLVGVIWLLNIESVAAQKITLSAQNMTVDKALNIVKKQTGYLLFYEYDLVQQLKPITINVKEASIKEVLDILLKNTDLTYSIEDKTVVIRKRSSAARAPINNQTIPGELVIKGHVYNDVGEPINGAYVILKGTKRVAITTLNGEFAITLTHREAENAFLIFSYVGYSKYEYRISGHKQVEVTLSKNIDALNDVVVTNSYSKPKRKEEVIGSIATVSAKELQTSRPIESFDKMLEGLAAGVQVEPNTELGTPVKINIRGQNALTNLSGSNRTTLTTSSQPLYVVDGVPIIEQRRTDEPLAFINNEELLNPLTGINPDDIESISVLKDAAAASIYGANAGNGVIIITTKKGKAGKSRINVGYNSGWAQSINRIKWLNGKQYHELMKETYINDGRSPADAELLAGSSDMNTPWFELVNRYSTYDNIDLDFSGGNESTQYRISGSYLKQDAIQRGNDFEKFYFRMRIDHAFSKKFNMSVSLSPTITNKNGVNIYSSIPIIPNVPSYNADGSFYSLSTIQVPNPLAVIAQNINKASGGTLNGNIRLEYAIAKNLRVSTNNGVDLLINKLILYDNPKNSTGASKNGFAQIFDRTNFGWISSSQINWQPIIKTKHKFDVTGGFEAQSQTTKLLSGSGTGFSYSKLIELSTANTRNSASSAQYAKNYSFYSQLLYDYNSKYFVSISAREDAASIFGDNVSSTYNAGAGIGWVLSKENWFPKIKSLDLLRFRYSYGTTGNSRIGSNEAKGLYSITPEGYNNEVTANLSTPPNYYLTWETNVKRNIGIDISLQKRINITVEFYRNLIKKAINPVNIPLESGFTTILANTADMENKGMDASINALIATGKFKWSSTLNLGFNKNKVVKVYGDAVRFASDNAMAALLKGGVSTSAIWGFQYAGVDANTGRELYYDNTGKVVSVFNLDRNLRSAYYIGDRLPKVQGGVINTFSYKGFSATVTIVYSFGAKKLIDYRNENNGRNLQNRNQSVNLLDRWQKPGDVASIPKLSTGVSGFGNPIVSNSSRYVYDDTYIKLSNVSLGYTLPTTIAQKYKLYSLTVFVNATNLAYWYKQKSPPGRNGIREYKFNFPEAQTFTWGFKIGI
jgi:TonB-dependent starch-binding outer membrane protein SusC